MPNNQGRSLVPSRRPPIPVELSARHPARRPTRIVVTGHSPDVLPHWAVPALHEVVEGWPFAKLTADDEKLIFLMRKMAGFARIGHVCSCPLILEVVDLRKRFIQPP